MEVTKNFSWLKVSHFEKTPVLQAIVLDLNQNGKDLLMLLEVNLEGNKTPLQMNLYGDNLNRMIDYFGNETNKWIGNPIKLQRTAKNTRVERI